MLISAPSFRVINLPTLAENWCQTSQKGGRSVPAETQHLYHDTIQVEGHQQFMGFHGI